MQSDLLVKVEIEVNVDRERKRQREEDEGRDGWDKIEHKDAIRTKGGLRTLC